MPNEFENRARRAIADKHGEGTASRVMGDPSRHRPEDDEVRPRTRGVAAFTEFGVQVGDRLWVVTDSPSRAKRFSERSGHVGLTLDELRALHRATGGELADRQTVDAIARIKTAFPGATVLEAHQLQGEDHDRKKHATR